MTDEEPNLSPPVDDCQELEIEDSYTSDISCMVSSEELHELEVGDVLQEPLLFQGGDNNDYSFLQYPSIKASGPDT